MVSFLFAYLSNKLTFVHKSPILTKKTTRMKTNENKHPVDRIVALRSDKLPIYGMVKSELPFWTKHGLLAAPGWEPLLSDNLPVTTKAHFTFGRGRKHFCTELTVRHYWPPGSLVSGQHRDPAGKAIYRFLAGTPFPEKVIGQLLLDQFIGQHTVLVGSIVEDRARLYLAIYLHQLNKTAAAPYQLLQV